MRGSLQIARLFGIPVFVHWSFSFLFLFIAYTSYADGYNWQHVLLLSSYVLALFGCVVLHEFGHVLSARYYGINTQDVTILPIGGLARLNKIPEKPIQELVVAIAGPMVNVFICVILAFTLVFFFDAHLSLSEIASREQPRDLLFEVNETASFLLLMARANFWLVIFNMVPAFPMDGGRVFRALMAMRYNRTKATFTASLLGQIFAVGFLLIALLPLLKDFFSPETTLGKWLANPKWEVQPILALVSFFIFSAARNEYKSVRIDEIMRRHTIANLLRTQYTALRTIDLMQTPILEMRKGFEHSFLVFDDATTLESEAKILRGVLQDEDTMICDKNNDHNALVLTYMTKDFEQTIPTESIKNVYDKMLETGQYLMPVVNEKTLLGVVDMYALQNFIASHDKVA